MPRELRIGDRVRTPWGDGVVASAVYQGTRGHTYDVAIRTEKGGEPAVRVISWHVDNLEPLPRDIPRKHVEMLHAAVAKRVAELAAEANAAEDIRTRESAQDCYDDLSEFAEAVRLLLEVDDDAA